MPKASCAPHTLDILVVNAQHAIILAVNRGTLTLVRRFSRPLSTINLNTLLSNLPLNPTCYLQVLAASLFDEEKAEDSGDDVERHEDQESVAADVGGHVGRDEREAEGGRSVC